jgi:hypothetical protein
MRFELGLQMLTNRLKERLLSFQLGGSMSAKCGRSGCQDSMVPNELTSVKYVEFEISEVSHVENRSPSKRLSQVTRAPPRFRTS